jgi:L-seryl-tRNA(Ser) seleniumtransferase
MVDARDGLNATDVDDVRATNARYRALPSVDRLLAHPLVADLDAGSALLTAVVREHLDRARATISSGGPPPRIDDLATAVAAGYARSSAPRPQRVINATGVIIHTNLGRAPLSRAAIAAMAAASQGYSDLEFDLDSGGRGSRHSHVEDVLRRATGAEAGMAVNNNASALLLALSALCAGREVVISRGQLVEIGGGFRIPDVMRQSGARLVEVGTTNRTYVADYVSASSDETAAWLRVHSSNFRQIGFVTQPEPAELAQAAHERGLLLLDDVGSGALLPTAAFGMAPEPTVQESLAASADLVLFSGDKLLGGPQAGIIVGRRGAVEQLRRHPLARAVRMDKSGIAALTATLLHYVKGEALSEVPVWRMIATPLDVLEARVLRWAEAAGAVSARPLPTRSMVGGGSLPEESLPSMALALSIDAADDLARRLRSGAPAIIARVEHDAVLLDARTVAADEDAHVIAALHRFATELGLDTH